jgi:cysteinyl-tRNA synthetase
VRISEKDLEILKTTFKLFVFEILGFVSERTEKNNTLDGIMSLVLEIRNTAKQNKDWDTADKIRKQLKESGVEIMDDKNGSTYRIN